MSLDDACFEFLVDIQAAAQELGRLVEVYGAPDNTIQYGSEIDALRRACADAGAQPIDDKAIGRLVALALATVLYHDDQISEFLLEMAVNDIPPKASTH